MVIIPDWLDKELWESFLQFRKEVKSKMTDHAQDLAIKKLDKWRKAGHDPKEIIENSIINGWKGLFEPKGNHHGKQAKYDPSAATVASITHRMGRAPANEIHEPLRSQVFESDHIGTSKARLVGDVE